MACAALLVPAAARTQENEWPAAMLELETLALRSPRRNTAFSHLQRLASESGRLDKWRARWEARTRTAGGAAESLMLGWLDIEAGRAGEARPRFARAAELAPENPHALLAHAESLLRAGDAQGKPLTHRAAELFTDTADKHFEKEWGELQRREFVGVEEELRCDAGRRQRRRGRPERVGLGRDGKLDRRRLV